MIPDDDPAPGPDDLDPVIGAVLRVLWAACSEAPWSLARVAKHAALSQSTLRRALSTLEDAGVVEVTGADDGRSFAVLTAAGRDFCATLDAGQAIETASRPTSRNASSMPDDQG